MTAQLPLVSILIPAYNSRFFEESLSSAVNQDYSNLEIIVCDDAPGPDIAGICKRIGDGRTTYIKNPRNLGFAGNFTECFNRAAGKYIKFLNDDDALLPTCVSRMVEEFEKHGRELNLVTSRRRVIDEHNKICRDIPETMPLTCVTSYMEGTELGDFVLEHSGNFIGEPTTVMFRKEDVDLHGRHLFVLNGNEYLCLADLSLWLRLLSRGGALYIAQPMSLYRIHPGQEQAKQYIGVKCISERLSIVLDASALGFLKSAERYDEAMRTVGKMVHHSFMDSRFDSDAKEKLRELKSKIPAEYLPAPGG